MRGQLNAFQKSMLQWNQFHPYSAVHVLKFRGTVDLDRLRTCIHRVLSSRNLAFLTLDLDQFTFRYETSSDLPEIQTIPAGEAGITSLIAEMERQLNLPFAFTQKFSPFRFLVAPAGDSFYLGIVYFHPVADAESILRLLEAIVSTYTGNGGAESNSALDLYPCARSGLLSRHPTVFARKLLGFPGQLRRLRQSYRVRYSDLSNTANGFAYFSLSPEELRLLVSASKSWSVTVNDLFLALLMKSLSPHTAGRARERKRKLLSIGCIVNARKDLGIDSARVFGLFLGSFTVTHQAPDGIRLRSLAEDIRQQTSAIKECKLYLAAPIELAFASFMFKFFSPEQRKKFYPKNYPLWGGITNMNLNSLWNQSNREGVNAPMDYLRGVSTGPVTPLVLSVTTIGERVNIGVSYRTAVFNSADIQKFQDRFREHLEETRSES